MLGRARRPTRMTTAQRTKRLTGRQIAFRLASVNVALGLTVLAATGSILYALATWGQPHRSTLLFLAGAAFASAPLVLALPRRRIVSGRWREPFFVAWTVLLIVCIAGATAVDGGLASPYRALYLLPLIFAGLSYPPRSVVAVAIADVLAFVAVAVTQPGEAVADAFVGFTIVCGALMCI